MVCGARICMSKPVCVSTQILSSESFTFEPHPYFQEFNLFPSWILTAQQNGHHKTELTLPILASLYVHFMIRRLVPSLTTEIHLTVRLLHVHYDVIRGSSISSDHHHHHFLPGHCIAPSPTMAGIDYKKKGDDRSDGCTDSCINEQPKTRVVFKTGRDCRLFAASVLLGLKPLLPHIGTEALDLLAGSLALASEVIFLSYICVCFVHLCLDDFAMFQCNSM